MRMRMSVFNKSESNLRGAGLTEYYSGDDGKLEILMATQSSLESFNPAAESIEDYKERFDFHCTAHQIPEGRRKALFLTRIGCDAGSIGIYGTYVDSIQECVLINYLRLDLRKPGFHAQ